MFCIEAKEMSRKDSVINETFEELTENRNKWRSLVDDANRFKYLLKRGLMKKLDTLEYFELRCLLKGVGVNIEDLNDIEKSNVLKNI